MIIEYGATTILLSLLVIILLVKGIKQVPQGFEWTIERFGRYTHTLKPGINLIIPFIDSVGVRLNMMERVLDIPSQEVISRDNAMVRVDGVCFFQVIESSRAAYEVNDLVHAISNLNITNIRTVLGSLDLDEMLSKRDYINSKLLEVVDNATAPWGVKITRIEIKDIIPPKDLVSSMALQMKSEREKRAKVLQAEGVRQAEILQAEGEKQATILQAEGKREAAFREAEARVKTAEAEAFATKVVSEAIAKGDRQAINYFVAEKYVDALGKIAGSNNQKVIMMPLEASNVIGSIAGISELLQNKPNEEKSEK